MILPEIVSRLSLKSKKNHSRIDQREDNIPVDNDRIIR